MEVKVTRAKVRTGVFHYTVVPPGTLGQFEVSERYGWGLERGYVLESRHTKIKVVLSYEEDPSWFELAFKHPKLSGFCEVDGKKTARIDVNDRSVDWHIDIVQDAWRWTTRSKVPGTADVDMQMEDPLGVVRATVLGNRRTWADLGMGSIKCSDADWTKSFESKGEERLRAANRIKELTAENAEITKNPFDFAGSLCSLRSLRLILIVALTTFLAAFVLADRFALPELQSSI